MKNGIMKIGKKIPAASTAGKKLLTTQHKISQIYPPCKYRIQIGEILLFMVAGNEQPEGWRQFEQLLCQCYEGGVL